MKTSTCLLFPLFLFLIPFSTIAQVEIEFNSSNTQPHLLLKETADDFARLNYQNSNSTSAYWSLMGKIGDMDSLSLFRLFYEGLEISAAPFVVTGDLRLGIGMSDPPARLSLKQALDQDDMGFRIINDAGTGSARLWMDGNDFHIHPGSNIQSGLTLKSTGRIGAFTDVPEAKFHVFGNEDAVGDLFLVNKEIHLGGSFYDTIRILEAKNDGDVFIRRLGVQEDDPTHRLDLNTVSVGENPFRIRILDDTKFRVLSNGGTSIGSGNPTPPDNGLYVHGSLHVGTTSGATGYKVAIDGKVICEELTVVMSGDWPDYVFGPDYDILSLEEVEQFIVQNKHLPGVPSAAHIESNGIHTSEMFKMLMEKIEELTLYSIAQQHKMKEQQQLIDKLFAATLGK